MNEMLILIAVCIVMVVVATEGNYRIRRFIDSQPKPKPEETKPSAAQEMPFQVVCIDAHGIPWTYCRTSDLAVASDIRYAMRNAYPETDMHWAVSVNDDPVPMSRLVVPSWYENMEIFERGFDPDTGDMA